MSAPYVTNLQCIVFDVMDRVFWSSETDTEMKEVILGDATGHWMPGILHGEHVHNEDIRKGQELRLYQIKTSPPKDDKRGKIWMFSQQTIVVPVKHWLVLPPAPPSNEVMLKGMPRGNLGW